MNINIEIYRYIYICIIAFMFRSYEFSLNVSCSEFSCPARSPETVLINVTSPGYKRT